MRASGGLHLLGTALLLVCAAVANAVNLCGVSWSDAASKCDKCPGGYDGQCPDGQTCYGGHDDCTESARGKRCGTSYSDAEASCGTECPQGVDAECPSGEGCYADVSCSGSSDSGDGGSTGGSCDRSCSGDNCPFKCLDGVPVGYLRLASPDIPRTFLADSDFIAKLDDYIAEVKSYTEGRWGAMTEIWSAGAYVDKPGMHGKGRAFDIDKIVWQSNTVSPYDRHHAGGDTTRRNYLCIDAIARLFFRYTLDGYYNADHEDHIHVDVSTGVRFEKSSKTDTSFLQAACNAFAGTSIASDGAYGPNTQAAYETLMSKAGLSGNIWDSPSLYKTLLRKIAEKGAAGQAF